MFCNLDKGNSNPATSSEFSVRAADKPGSDQIVEAQTSTLAATTSVFLCCAVTKSGLGPPASWSTGVSVHINRYGAGYPITASGRGWAWWLFPCLGLSWDKHGRTLATHTRSTDTGHRARTKHVRPDCCFVQKLHVRSVSHPCTGCRKCRCGADELEQGRNTSCQFQSLLDMSPFSRKGNGIEFHKQANTVQWWSR